MKRIFASGALILISSVANSADWWALAVDSEIVVFLNRDHQISQAGDRRFWIRTDYRNGETNLALHSVRCDSKMSAVVQATIYDSAGKTMTTTPVGYRADYHYIVPDSVMDNAATAMCTNNSVAVLKKKNALKTEDPADYARNYFLTLSPAAEAASAESAPAAEAAPAEEPLTPWERAARNNK